MNSTAPLNAACLELPPSKKSKQANISFISKMQQILKDHECRSYVQWSEDGTSFHIQSNTEFTNYVLPKYFKHKNFNSFVRQLNMYGFRKTKSKEEGFESTYSHHLFKRSENSVVHKIKRLQPKKSESEDEENEYFIEKYSGTRNAKKTEVAQSTKFGVLSKQLSKLTEKFRDFEDVAENLKSTIAMQNNQIKIMASELVRLRSDGENQYKDLLNQFSSFVSKNTRIVGGSEPFLTEPQDSYATQQLAHGTAAQNLPHIGEANSSVPAADFRKYHPRKNLRETFEPNLSTSEKHAGALQKRGQNKIISRTIAVNDTYYFDCVPNQQQNYEMKGDKLQSYESHPLEEPSQVTGERESFSYSNEYEEEEEEEERQPLGQHRGYLVDDAYYGERLPAGSYPYKMLQKTRLEGHPVQRDVFNDASNVL